MPEAIRNTVELAMDHDSGKAESLSANEDYTLSILSKEYSPPQAGDLTDRLFRWEDYHTTTLTMPATEEGKPPQIIHKYYSPKERASILRIKCQELYDAATDSVDHVRKLESQLSTYLHCEWRPQMSLAELVRRTVVVLERLPQLPTVLPDSLEDIQQHFFDGEKKTPGTLKVNQCIPGNLVRFAAYHVMVQAQEGFSDRELQDALNGTGELIQTCVTLAEEGVGDSAVWFVVRAYLWSFWQRARMLYLSCFLVQALARGFDHGVESAYWSRNFQVSHGLSLRAFTEDSAARTKRPNMCGWMFELLRGDPKCTGLDFDLLHRRFGDAFGEKTPRCQKDGQAACAGNNWRECLRFDRTESANQTAHDQFMEHSTANESRLIWDEASYLGVEGARAVSIGETDDSLKYCGASNRTMAISHVWSHGQGGRPDVGIHKCLHDRYVRLAKSLGCDSYWIDSACIPSDDDLRRDAIRYINDVFYNSKCVLVCDKDIMDFDAENPSTERLESIIAAVLFCDWNIRAWTMLEALKGRGHISILCRDDRVIKFGDVLQHVADHGRIDLAIFTLLLPHTIPWRKEGMSKLMPDIFPNDINLEIVGSWLSHRPASREFDDVVIWSLCLGQHSQRARRPEQLWENQTLVNTGFLMSSAPRLTIPGRSWAPRTTFAFPDSSENKLTSVHRPFDSSFTALAKIRPEGIWARWWVHEWDRLPTLLGYCRRGFEMDQERSTRKELQKVRRLLNLHERNFALLRPEYLSVNTRFDGVQQTPSSAKSGVLLAVCESDKKEEQAPPGDYRLRNSPSYKWLWRGVYEWPHEVNLPEFHLHQGFWIA